MDDGDVNHHRTTCRGPGLQIGISFGMLVLNIMRIFFCLTVLYTVIVVSGFRLIFSFDS